MCLCKNKSFSNPFFHCVNYICSEKYIWHRNINEAISSLAVLVYNYLFSLLIVMLNDLLLLTIL